MISIGKSSQIDNTSLIYPDLIVFDLDMCLWSPETYLLTDITLEKDIVRGKLGKLDEEGVIGVRCGSYESTLRLFPGALAILQGFVNGSYGSRTRIAVASTAVTPLATKIAHKALSMLEVVPGVTVRDALAIGWDKSFNGNIQIGRSPPLSTSKARSHFPAIQRETGVAYNQMIYFDDCNWDDHCAEVASSCPGVITQATPHGITEREFLIAVQKYSRNRQ